MSREWAKWDDREWQEGRKVLIWFLGWLAIHFLLWLRFGTCGSLKTRNPFILISFV